MNEHNDKLNIPKKIKIGFNNRSDTYTGKLAYVTYLNQKGDIAKETSWQNWRDKDIESQEFDNTPTEGFVLNKNVGGFKSGWNFRSSYTRIYDPRGFEFEITIPNLLFILQECTCEKGKGLIGEFVYAWDGKDLLLLPTTSAPYIESMKVINKTSKIGAKDLVIGNTYRSKDVEEIVYIGRLKWNYFKNNNPKNTYYSHKASEPRLDLSLTSKNVHTFYDQTKKIYYGIYDLKKILYCVDESVITKEDAANLKEKFENETLQGSLDKIEKLSWGIGKSRYVYQDNQWMFEDVSNNDNLCCVTMSRIYATDVHNNSIREDYYGHPFYHDRNAKEANVVVTKEFYMFDTKEKRIKEYCIDGNYKRWFKELEDYSFTRIRYQKDFSQEEINKWTSDNYIPKVVMSNGKEFSFDSVRGLSVGWDIFEASIPKDEE